MFKVGDKVKIPTQKTADTPTSLENCSAIRGLPEGQDYLFITHLRGNNEVTLSTRIGGCDSRFSINDLVPYEDNYEIY